mmetsp:Transcript_139157/g.197041  ORF Transcript_139157/g.197041 Transcript_139157/m.197041 type:complete len:262 (+) Transcript_139157:413-1198(+)
MCGTFRLYIPWPRWGEFQASLLNHHAERILSSGLCQRAGTVAGVLRGTFTASSSRARGRQSWNFAGVCRSGSRPSTVSICCCPATSSGTRSFTGSPARFARARISCLDPAFGRLPVRVASEPSLGVGRPGGARRSPVVGAAVERSGCPSRPSPATCLCVPSPGCQDGGAEGEAQASDGRSGHWAGGGGGRLLQAVGRKATSTSEPLEQFVSTSASSCSFGFRTSLKLPTGVDASRLGRSVCFISAAQHLSVRMLWLETCFA